MDPLRADCYQQPNSRPVQHFQMQMPMPPPPWTLPSPGFWDPRIPPPLYAPTFHGDYSNYCQRWNQAVKNVTVYHPPHQRESDQSLLDNFFAARPQYSAAKRQSTLQVADVRAVLKTCLRHIKELKEILDSLKDTVEREDSLCLTIQQRAIFLQDQIKSSLEGISSHEQLQSFKAKLKRIGKKRDRFKRQKLRRVEAKLEQEKNNKLVHERLDLWLHSVRQKYLDQQMENQMKREADSILCEVRRKKAEATKTLALVKSVEKLRLAKKSSSEAKGQFSTNESDLRFADAVSRFESNLSTRLLEYGEEERTLQAMLDEERRETRDAEEKRRLREHDDRLEVVRREIVTSLFGIDATVYEHDPRFCFWELYTRAERDPQTLVNIRRDWDVWLVETDADRKPTESTNVPIGWVTPSDPSSDAWAAVLEKRQ